MSKNCSSVKEALGYTYRDFHTNLLLREQRQSKGPHIADPDHICRRSRCRATIQEWTLTHEVKVLSCICFACTLISLSTWLKSWPKYDQVVYKNDWNEYMAWLLLSEPEMSAAACLFVICHDGFPCCNCSTREMTTLTKMCYYYDDDIVSFVLFFWTKLINTVMI